MKYLYLTIFICFSFCLKGLCQQFYDIPTQQFYPYKELNSIPSFNGMDTVKIKVDSFQISNQINFSEYKEYLSEIKKDSSNSFYLLQLPDSSILSKENYTKYISDNYYNGYPVVGIRWEAAMNFCKWKTLKENKGDSIEYIYRLPKISEWISAKKYLNDNLMQTDFNKNYSDWSIDLYYEGGYNLCVDVIYFAKTGDAARMKRIRVLGNSFLYQTENLANGIGYYRFNGYRQIAFRVVKEYIIKSENKKNTAQYLLNYWNIKR